MMTKFYRGSSKILDFSLQKSMKRILNMSNKNKKRKLFQKLKNPLQSSNMVKKRYNGSNEMPELFSVYPTLKNSL
jgi:hypothetical protein